MSPTAVSLFAGVGGIDLALERAGFRVTSAVEIDTAARGVLADRFPNTTLHTDVTKVTADELRADGFDAATGVVAAGFPCQDLSVAGRRKGMGAGTRSGLYWHVVRLVADLRPRWVILENVPGLLSAVCPCPGDGACGDECPGDLHTVNGGACGPGRCMVEHGGAMGAVLGSLGELGYGFAYRVLDAQHFGVPQRRRRVVIVGCAGDERRPVEVLLEPEGGERDPATGDEAGSRVADDLGYGVAVAGRSGVANTLTARDAKGPLPDQSLGTVVVGSLTSHATGGWRVGADEAAAGQLVPIVTAIGDVTHALTAEGHDASEDGTGNGVQTEITVRRLTPRECERMQGFPDDWTATSNGKAQADSPRYQQMGNAVAVPVFEWVGRRIRATESEAIA